MNPVSSRNGTTTTTVNKEVVATAAAARQRSENSSLPKRRENMTFSFYQPTGDGDCINSSNNQAFPQSRGKDHWSNNSIQHSPKHYIPTVIAAPKENVPPRGKLNETQTAVKQSVKVNPGNSHGRENLNAAKPVSNKKVKECPVSKCTREAHGENHKDQAQFLFGVRLKSKSSNMEVQGKESKPKDLNELITKKSLLSHEKISNVEIKKALESRECSKQHLNEVITKKATLSHEKISNVEIKKALQSHDKIQGGSPNQINNVPIVKSDAKTVKPLKGKQETPSKKQDVAKPVLRPSPTSVINASVEDLHERPRIERENNTTSSNNGSLKGVKTKRLGNGTAARLEALMKAFAGSSAEAV